MIAMGNVTPGKKIKLTVLIFLLTVFVLDNSTLKAPVMASAMTVRNKVFIA